MPVTIELSDGTARRIVNWCRDDLRGDDHGEDLLLLVGVYINEAQKVKADPDLIQEMWNQTFKAHPQVPKVRGLRRSKGRMAKLRERWGEMQAEGDPAEMFARCFSYMIWTPFFLGKNDRKWVVTFDYLLQNDTKWRQILARCEARTEQGGTDSGWSERFVAPPE